MEELLRRKEYIGFLALFKVVPGPSGQKHTRRKQKQAAKEENDAREFEKL